MKDKSSSKDQSIFRYTCRQCKTQFVGLTAFRSHIQNYNHVTNTGTKVYRCNICSRIYLTAAGHRYHRVAHILNGSEVYKCQSSQKPMFRCQVCLTLFSTKSNLKRHLMKQAKNNNNNNNNSGSDTSKEEKDSCFNKYVHQTN